MLVDHEDARSRASLQSYLAVLCDGGSAVVRPQETYAGWDRVVEHLRAMSGSPLLVTDLAGTTERLPAAGTGAAAPPTDLVAFHTSGSTGSPKCVVYDVDRVRDHAAMVADVLGLAAGTTHLALPPCRFAYGLSIVHSHALAGVPVRFLDPASDPVRLCAALRATSGPVQLYALPQQLTQLLAVPHLDVDLRSVVVAGGRLTGRAAAELARLFPGVELVNMYGQAELGPRLATWRGPAADFVEGSIGGPVPGARLALGEPDEQGRRPLLATSRYAASHVLRAPYDAPEPGAAADEPVPTGDLAELTDAGCVFRGRGESFANVAGTKIDLAELTALTERSLPVVAVRAHTRTSRVTGDDVVVLQLVPAPAAELGTAAVRRVLHPVLGSLVALVDVRVVTHLDVGESGK